MSTIFLIDRHFWPDTNPLAIMLKPISHWLAESGARVVVITAQPGYRSLAAQRREPWRERWSEGVDIYRLPLLPGKWGRPVKFLNYGLFLLQSALVFFALSLANRRQRRACITSSIPPVLQPLILCLLSRLTGTRFIYNIHDIYPEVIVPKDDEPGLLARMLARLDRWTIRMSYMVLVLSEDMRQTILRRGCRPDNIQILNNFPLQQVPDSIVDPAIAARRNRSEGLRFVFAGNLGKYQSLPELVRFFLEDAPPETSLTLLGSGAMRTVLEEMIDKGDQDRVRLMDFVPAEKVPEILADFDYGIATLKPELVRVAYPSKLLTYWNLGLPVLTTVASGSQLARDIDEQDLGVVVPIESIGDGVAALIADRERFLNGVQQYRKSHELDRWRRSWIQIGNDIAGAGS